MKKIFAVVLIFAVIFSFSGCFTVAIDIVSPETGEVTVASSDDAVTQSGTDTTLFPPLPEETVDEQEATETVSEVSTEYHDDYDIPTEAPVTVVVPAEAKEKTPTEMNSAELIAYFDKTLNQVKTDKVGFKKSKLTSILDLQLSNSAANSIVSFVKSALLSDTADETTVNKGESSNDVMSPTGCSYAANLAVGDVDTVKVSSSGGNYVIKVTLKEAVNPEKSGPYGKVFDFMTVDDVISTYAPKVGATVAREDIEVVFSDCYAELTVDASGHIVKYVTYVKGVMNMNNASIKKVITINSDVSVTLGSTTEYTDFSY